MLTTDQIARHVRTATNMSRNRFETGGIHMLAVLIGVEIDDLDDRDEFWRLCGLPQDTWKGGCDR